MMMMENPPVNVNNGVFYQGNDQRGGQGDGFAASADDDNRKLFLGGLSWETGDDDLIEHFSAFGQVSNVTIKYNAATGHPRGFGFITFANEDTIGAVMAAQPHTVKGKQIDLRRAKSKTASKKIFVGGVDSNTEEETLREYFSRFGKVDGIELPFDKVRNRRREFCFVIFDTKEAADNACVEAKQMICGRECDIKRAQPQMNSMNGRGRGRGGGPSHFGHHNQFGPPHQNGWGANDFGGYVAPHYMSAWSSGPRGGAHHQGGRGGHQQAGRPFHKARVYTGTNGGHDNGQHANGFHHGGPHHNF